MNSKHFILAKAWCQYNGQKGTQKQVEKIMARIEEETLLRMLSERNITVIF